MGSNVEKGVPLEVGDEEILLDVWFFLQPPEPELGQYVWGIEFEEAKLDGFHYHLNDEQLEQVTQYIIGRISDDN